MKGAMGLVAALPAAMVVLPMLGFAIGLNIPTPLIIFLLLFGLMLTGMPISISLGLTVLTFLFTIIVGTLGANYVWAIGHTDQVSADLELPLWIVYLCIPLGSYLMCFRFLQVAVTFWRTGDLPRHDVAHVEGLTEAIEAVPDLHPAPVAGSRR